LSRAVPTEDEWSRQELITCFLTNSICMIVLVDIWLHKSEFFCYYLVLRLVDYYSRSLARIFDVLTFNSSTTEESIHYKASTYIVSLAGSLRSGSSYTFSAPISR